ncbi:hypothetical protein ACQKP1_15900 [Allorhizobium sp. NPDC080224]|uniref:hypothetical protein n=1 Tax=Allorhizobium sp. NPDC080224 TaxID=3390547 RepID=UPI003D07F20F
MGDRMQFRSTTRSDLAKVFRDSAPRMRTEYENAGFNLREVKSIFTQLADAGQAHTLTHGNEALAVISWSIDEVAIHTSFAAKESFFSSRSVRFCFEHIRKIQADNGNLPVCSTSFSPHPSVPKWFKVLGFEHRQSDSRYVEYWLAPL